MATKSGEGSADNSASYLGRLLDLLELVVSEAGSNMSLTELAERTEMPVSSASRLLGQLRSWGFLVEAEGGQAAAGPRLISMSAAVARSVYGDPRLKSATQALARASRESATAGRIVGDRIIIVARSEPSSSLRAVNRTGEVLPPGRSAMGKAVLALLPTERQMDLLRADGDTNPELTLKNLQDELAETRDRSYAVDEETLTAGLRCRAVAVLGWDGTPVAALSIGGPSVRFTPEIADECVRSLHEQADQLSRRS